MSTYAESKGYNPINWDQVLNKLVNHELPKTQILKYAKLSREWVTCACGSQCDDIPRTKCGIPKDYSLCTLGSNFAGLWGEIVVGHTQLDHLTFVYGLKSTLEKIEQRSAELLEKMS